MTSLTFRRFGPLARFDHHRHPAGHPDEDLDRGILYAARTLSCCVVEIFGDSGIITPYGWMVARLTLTRDLRLLDLRGAGAMRAGSVMALGQAPDHALAQTWSRYLYDEAVYGDCDGLIYRGAHSGEEAIALYERAESSLACPATDLMALNNPSLRPILLTIADQYNLDMAP